MRRPGIVSRRLLLLAALLAPAAAAAPDRPEPRLDGFYARWLAGVAHLATGAERRVFEDLATDLEREVFIRAFWRARVDAAGSERPLRRWRQSFEEALERFGDLDEDRARAMLQAGKPARILVFPGCDSVLRPMRVWTFERAAAAGGPFHLVFYRSGGLEPGVFRHWSPTDGGGPLVTSGAPWTLEKVLDYALAKNCFRWRPGEARPFVAALRSALGPDALRRRAVPPPPDPAWLETLAAGSALPGSLVEIRYPGRSQRKTVVHGRIAVDDAALDRNPQGLLYDRVVIEGDVRLGDRLVDAFRVVHYLAGATRPGEPVELDFYRRLRPGRYTLSLRAADAYGLGLLRAERRLEVPRLEAEAEPPAGFRLGFAGLSRAEVGMLTTFPSVEVQTPGTGLAVGEIEVAAMTTGGPIERVDFLLDGAAAATDAEPPYAATLALGGEARPRTVEAVAYDAAGRELGRDRLALNAAPPRLAVRLRVPDGGREARVAVEVPAGERLDRVELYLDRERIAVLHEASFAYPLPPRPLARPGAARFLRAVAVLASGEQAEELVFLDAADPVDEIDVRLVEVYASVLDAGGRFVRGLDADDFRVFEDGAPQRVLRFDTVENLAINVALLMDVSSSMRRKIEVATASARRFFDTVVTPKDRASFLSFNHDVRQVVPFTNDLGDLHYGTGGFRAWGTTRLHDSLVYAAHAFGGLDGKRALILLSDGQDVDSDFSFKQVLDLTLRAGVAVYPIVLGAADPQTAAELELLAERSGGRFFSIFGVGELDRVYRRIEEELRSQYLLVYEPPGGGRGALRRIRVEVLGEGLRTRSIQGYYP